MEEKNKNLGSLNEKTLRHQLQLISKSSEKANPLELLVLTDAMIRILDALNISEQRKSIL
ncbi:hypothetical protein FEZ51_08395 [Pediococcus stilesii]|uniref:Uncharacterized protein n=1 Tax=Pediococcus stilesii TaxID=331679 RepID=A0A5R9BSF8_9LACO|nr:hypothetical protein [Pediococcus stilesii]TLQ03614.1 hypothetical protein FEZ51_08395 [Pediococcus stilesii]